MICICRRSVSTASSTASYSSCGSQINAGMEIKSEQTMAIVEATANSRDEMDLSNDSVSICKNGEKKSSIQSLFNNPLDKIFGTNEKKKSSSASSMRSSISEFGRKHGISLGRHHSHPEKIRTFRYN